MPSKPSRIDKKNPKALSAKEQKKVKDFLSAHGHSPDKVNGKKWGTDAETLESLLDLHGVTLNQYHIAGGSGE